MNFEILFNSGYTDGTEAAIWYKLENKETKYKPILDNAYDFGYFAAYNYYKNIGTHFTKREYLMFLKENKEVLTYQKEASFLLYEKFYLNLHEKDNLLSKIKR